MDNERGLHPPAPSQRERPASVTIALVDERRLLRDCVAILLRQHAPDIEVRGFSRAEEIDLFDMSLAVIWIDQCCRRNPAVMAQRVAAIRRRYPGARIAGFLGSDDPAMLKCAVELGIALVKLNGTTIEIAVASLRLAIAGGTFAPSELMFGGTEVTGAKEMNETPPLPHLRRHDDIDASEDVTFAHGITPREMELIQRLNRGLQNKLIAHELGISESTVKVHLRNIMRKLRATNRTQVAVLMREVASNAPHATEMLVARDAMRGQGNR
jgi:DNA-binding NarL/FixJ family response regulator